MVLLGRRAFFCTDRYDHSTFIYDKQGRCIYTLIGKKCMYHVLQGSRSEKLRTGSLGGAEPPLGISNKTSMDVQFVYTSYNQVFVRWIKNQECVHLNLNLKCWCFRNAPWARLGWGCRNEAEWFVWRRSPMSKIYFCTVFDTRESS